MAKKNKKTAPTETPATERTAGGKRSFYDPTRTLHSVMPCVLVVFAVFLGFLLVMDAIHTDTGPLGNGLVWFFKGLHSYCVYLLPLLFLWVGISWRADVRRHRVVKRIVYFTLLPILIDALYFTFSVKTAVFSFTGFFQTGVNLTGAGLFGSLLGYGLWKLTMFIGLPVIIALYVVLFLYDLLGITPASIMEKRAKRRAEKEAAEADRRSETGAVEKDTVTEPTVAVLSSKETAREDKKDKKKKKEAEKARRAQDKAEEKRRAKEAAGYFPDEEETFDQLKRRLGAEQMEIERTDVAGTRGKVVPPSEPRPQKRAAIPEKGRRAPMEVDTPLPTAGIPEAPPVAAIGAGEKNALPGAGYAPIGTPSYGAPSYGASRADDVFRSFDPVRAMPTEGGETVLIPADDAVRTKRETLAPVKGSTGAGGSFRIHVEHMEIPSTRNTGAEQSASQETQAKSFSDYESITRRATPDEPAAPTLPYVHPATMPADQPQASRDGTPVIVPPAPPRTAFPSLADETEESDYLPVPDGLDAADDQPVIRTYQETAASDPGIEVTERVVEHGTQYPIPDPPAKVQKEEKRTRPDYSKNYLFPPLSLLRRSIPVTSGSEEAEIQERGQRLIAAFATFKIDIQIKEVVIGPRITRFSIEPPAGVRINTLINLTDDICRLMASKTLRIEPIPETPYLGVEIPNKHATNVSLASLIDTEAFRHAKNVTTVPIGAGVTGAPVFADISKMPHLLVAGATGMGKSVFVNSILLSLLYHARPDEVKLILVDPKQVEMSMYNGIPHLLVPPVIDAQKAAGALIWAVGEMERRYQLMVKANVRTIESYNQYVDEDPSRGEKQPKIIIVIDELNDLMMQAKDAVESSIMRLAQKARAAGIHLILGTQRPSVDVITGTIKANIPSRVALHVTSGTDSRTILDVYGAEKLLDKGDMLVMLAGAEPMRIQSAFASDEEVENVTTFLRNNAGAAVYDDIISAQIDAETEKYKNAGKKERSRDDEDGEDYDGSIFEDSRFMQACQVAFESGKISTSLLQRRCKLGYGKAASYIDTMEMIGMISGQDGSKPRELLMTRDQFMEMVARDSHSGD